MGRRYGRAPHAARLRRCGARERVCGKLREAYRCVHERIYHEHLYTHPITSRAGRKRMS